MFAELLSKVHQPGFKKEVTLNPGNSVKASTGFSAHKKKIIILSVVVIAAVLSGIFFLRFIESLSGTSDINMVSVPDDRARENIRAKQAAADESSIQMQGINPVNPDKQSDALKETQPVMSAKTAGIKITDEKAPLPKNIVKNEDTTIDEIKLENIPSPAIKTEGVDAHGLDAYLYSARGHEVKGDYSKALTDYKKALEMDRGNYAVINNIAYIYLQMNLVDDSIRYSLMAAEINRGNPAAFINLGIAYAKAGDMASAQKYLNEAFALGPDNQSVIMNLAILHEKQEQFQEAAEYFTRLVKLGSTDGYPGLARIYEKQGRTDEAIKIYRLIYEHSSADDKMKSYARQRSSVLNNRK